MSTPCVGSTRASTQGDADRQMASVSANHREQGKYEFMHAIINCNLSSGSSQERRTTVHFGRGASIDAFNSSNRQPTVPKTRASPALLWVWITISRGEYHVSTLPNQDQSAPRRLTLGNEEDLLEAFLEHIPDGVY